MFRQLYFYYEAGDLVQTIDPEGNVTSVERNVLGQMVSTTDEQGRTTKYEYTDNGDVSKIFYEEGTRQFRVKPDDYLGNHGIGQPTVPNTPHVYFEFLIPRSSGNGFDVIKNIHVPIK